MKKIREVLIFLLLLFIFVGTIVLLLYNSKSKEKVKNNINTSINENISQDFEGVYSSDISEDSIYLKAYINPTSEIDLTNPSVLYENADLVIVGTIISKGKGTMLEEYEYAGIPGTISVDTILKGSISNNDVDFFSNGGYCTVKEYVDIMSKNKKEKIEKLGLSKLTEKEQNEKYLVFNYKFGKNFKVGNRYIIMLKEVNGKLIAMSNYGFINVSRQDNITSLCDVLNIVDDINRE